MRRTIVVGVLVACGAVAWWLGEHLSTDAVALLLGLFFGLTVGLGCALLVGVARQREEIVTPRREQARDRETRTLPVFIVLPPGADMRQIGVNEQPAAVDAAEAADAAWWWAGANQQGD